MSKFAFEFNKIPAIGFHHARKWHFLSFPNLEIFPQIQTTNETDLGLFEWHVTHKGKEPLKKRDFPREAGEFHPRIWRPGNCPTWLLAGGEYKEGGSIGGETTLRRSVVAAEVLVSQLKAIFRTIEPAPENGKTFGQEIRNVLLLACMEVESAWTGVLKANGYPQLGHWKTGDYVKLLLPMRLKEYAVSMLHYPEYPPVSPFSTWESGSELAHDFRRPAGAR